MTDGAGARYTVIYDGHCSVCTRLAHRLAQMDRRGEFEIVASQVPGVRERFPWISGADLDTSLQLVRSSDNETWARSRAVEEILGNLRGARHVAWLFELPFARAIADRFYRWFASNRGRLGCGKHCSLP